ncbi:glycosyltransferase [Novosphingobium sp. KACC 22771]|uniref:glycosyltransferase n=1 Tax=Novosphingobium sp. KACC 22771 TaxID=3025670 RepID=UPI00236576CF|nr:glycosyltransferase [Novosphingobium sp. KACC 22771]WDF72856.1 glycosyltransferase [Novosphingobium sp. KACC 22771]
MQAIGFLWAQFSAYHVDRCVAAASRLAGRAQVYAVQVCTKSNLYVWEPFKDVKGATTVTLFPDTLYESTSAWSRFRKQYNALRKCKTVFIGVAYSEPEILPMVVLLRLSGVRVIMMSATKYDDYPRSAWVELIKGALLSVYQGAIVGGRRQMEYLQFLGFRKRPILTGYNAVGLDRVRKQGEQYLPAEGVSFRDRPFVYVGRFVPKKNLEVLIEGFVRYVRSVGPQNAHKLLMVGSGPLEGALRQQIVEAGIEELVEFSGFLTAPEVAGVLARSLALVLVSTEEQWGLVVNEALAFGTPMLTSSPVGSNDALTRNLVNGYIVEPDSPEGVGRAMALLSSEEESWNRMKEESLKRRWMGDAERFADAVEVMLFPDATEARERVTRFMQEMGAAH